MATAQAHARAAYHATYYVAPAILSLGSTLCYVSPVWAMHLPLDASPLWGVVTLHISPVRHWTSVGERHDITGLPGRSI